MTNIKNKLFLITDKIKYTTNEIFENIKDCLSGYEINIYACGPSFSDFHDKLPINEKTIKVCVKTSIDIIEDADIFIFDNRVKAHKCDKFNYDIDNIFKIYMGDYFFDDFNNFTKNLPQNYNYPKNVNKFEPNLIFTPTINDVFLNPEEINLFTYNNNGIIYGKYNIFVPLMYKLLELFTYMGVKKFNITGCDHINVNFSQSHYYDKERVLNKVIGFDSFLNLYYEYILDYTKFNITLYSDESNANILIPRYKNLNMDYHAFNKFLTIDIENSLKEIKNINENQILYLKMIEYIHVNKINIVLPEKKIIFNKLDDIIKVLNYLKLELTFYNILKIQININIDDLYDKIPSKFDINEYKKINIDV